MSGLLVVAGEASGDLHGARLLSELQRLRPGVSAFGLGGDELAATGLDQVAHSGEVAVVGFFEVVKVLPRVRRIFRRLLEEVDERHPDAALLIDYPDFNLRLARALKRRSIPVIYYISPQVWAWRPGRVKTIARLVDRMLVLFPFEVEFYRERGVSVRHVGHPLVDEVPQLAHVWERPRRDGESVQVALLPGSRSSEVESLLPAMLAACGELAHKLPLAVRLIRASTVDRCAIDDLLRGSELPVAVVEFGRFEALAASHLALCASGTATLEVGLTGTPMLVLYRLKRWSYLLGRLLVKLPSFAMVNLVLGQRVVPELLQDEVEPGRIAAEALRLLEDPEEVARVRSGLALLRARLGEGGASARAAREVAEFVGGEGVV